MTLSPQKIIKLCLYGQKKPHWGGGLISITKSFIGKYL